MFLRKYLDIKEQALKLLCQNIHEYFDDEKLLAKQYGCFTASLEISILEG